jgi:putative spermidine/putrescine transport system permease protein
VGGALSLAPRRRGAGALPWLLLAPALAFLAAFFLVPLGIVGWLSLTDPRLGLENYTALFADGFHARVLAGTFGTALLVTLCCLLAGYPLAYAMVRAGGGLATALLALVAMSFWTSFLVRSYAWMVILGNRGPVASLSRELGWGAPELLFTRFSSTLAMVHILLPFMVMALYSIMRKIDFNLLRAARSLGAGPFQAFRTVFLPLSAPGIVNGCTLVFIVCLGFYVTPVLLGSPREQMIAGLIGQRVEELLEFGSASALSVLLLATTMLVFWIYNRLFGLDRLWG